MEIFEIHVLEYTDTRQGGNNPSYKLRPCANLEAVKKEIKKCLRKKTWRKGQKIEDFEIKLKRGTWDHDFGPEVITVTKTKLKE